MHPLPLRAVNDPNRSRAEDPHLCGEHGDVVELPAAPLLDRHGEEESVAIPGEDRFLVLQKGVGVREEVLGGGVLSISRPNGRFSPFRLCC